MVRREPHLERLRVEEHLRRVEPRAVSIGDEPVHGALGDGADPRVTVALQEHASLLDRPRGSVELNESDGSRVRRDNAHVDLLGLVRHLR